MTADSNRISYLPRDLAEELRRWAPKEVSGSEMFDLQRIAQRIFAAGYDQGYTAGYDENWDYAKRPNINTVNRLREALAETEAKP